MNKDEEYEERQSIALSIFNQCYHPQTPEELPLKWQACIRLADEILHGMGEIS